MRWTTLRLVAIGAGLAFPATAGAAGSGTIESVSLPTSAQGITAAPDGAVWVSLPARGTVARVAPDGSVTESAPLGGAPTGVAFAEGKVFATLTAAKQVAIVDADRPAAPATTVATPAGRCGPAGIAAGGNGSVYVSLPDDGACPGGATSAITSVTTAGVLGPTIQNRGLAYDLLAVNGSLWIPDFDGDVVRRTALDAGLTLQATHAAAPGAGPDAIAVAPNGDIVTSFYGANRLGRVSPASAPGTPLTVFGPAVPGPFGVAYAGGSLYVAGSASGGGSPLLARVLPDDSLGATIAPSAPSQPWDAAPGPDGSVVFTDLANPRLLRVTSRPPRATTGATIESNTGFARVSLTVNPGGNPAATRVEFGPTTAYGASAPAGEPTGTSDVSAVATLNGLQFGTTYHYRAVATTAEGTAYGEDRTFTTPVPTGQAPVDILQPAPKAPEAPSLPTLSALTAFTTSTKKGVTRVSKIRVTRLTGGEAITAACSGKGCPKKGRSVTLTAKRAGSLTLKAPKITKARFGKGAKVTVRVTKPGSIGVLSTLTVQGSKKPSRKRECVVPGAAAPTTC